ncbi:hypothetical protein [Prosthecobacter sp.]|uniref:hypothetical protein n=1 Tax=Prosthecobacter sp. TaxID=1965333 RepID=UPI003783BEBB
MKSHWLHITFSPGLSPIHHRCTVEITRAGAFRQVLAERKGGEWVEISPTHETQLSENDFAALEGAVACIDFPGLSARIRKGFDAGNLAIEVHAEDGTYSRVKGCILSDYRGYHDFQRIFEPAQRLWKLVCALLPQKEFLRGARF